MIPRECEDDLFEHIDGFVEGNGAFGKIAALALAEKIPLSEHPALAAMFEYKWKNPEAYWRDYEKWCLLTPVCIIFLCSAHVERQHAGHSVRVYSALTRLGRRRWSEHRTEWEPVITAAAKETGQSGTSAFYSGKPK